VIAEKEAIGEEREKQGTLTRIHFGTHRNIYRRQEKEKDGKKRGTAVSSSP
jgi:predicted RNA-binding protein